MTGIDLLNHEKEQAKEIADNVIGKLIDNIVIGPLLTEDQILYIWTLVSEHANNVISNASASSLANKIHNMKKEK
jgi:hypothetical protein